MDEEATNKHILRLETLSQNVIDKVDNMVGKMVDDIKETREGVIRMDGTLCSHSEKIARLNKVIFDDNGTRSLVNDVRYLTTAVDSFKEKYNNGKKILKAVGNCIMWTATIVSIAVGIMLSLRTLGLF